MLYTIPFEPTFEAWRASARDALSRGLRPEQIDWLAEDGQQSLLRESRNLPAPLADVPSHQTKVPAAFLELAQTVAAHRDPARWGKLYRVLYRLTIGKEPHLLANPADPDVRQCQIWAKAVGRDIHKLHAFVRFRLVEKDSESDSGRERYVAWIEPSQRSLRLAVPFFAKRFANMDWSILTPDECAHWDAGSRQLHFSPGANRNQVPPEDAEDDLWRTYYRSIFNLARLKLAAMQSEMPQKYWQNLPEARLIAQLAAQSQNRVDAMLAEPERPVKPTPENPYLRLLAARKRSTSKPNA